MNKKAEFFLEDASALLRPENLLKMDKNSILNLIIVLLPLIYLYNKKINLFSETNSLVFLTAAFLLVLVFYALTSGKEEEEVTLLGTEKNNFLLDASIPVYVF